MKRGLDPRKARRRERETSRIKGMLTICGSILLAGCGGRSDNDPPIQPDFASRYVGSLTFAVETADQPAGTFKASGTLSALTLTSDDAKRYRTTVPARVAIAFDFPNSVCDPASASVNMDVELSLSAELRTYSVSARAPLVVQTRCCSGADCLDVKLDTVIAAVSSCNGSSDPLQKQSPDHLAEMQWRTQCGDPASGTVISTLSWSFDAASAQAVLQASRP